MRSAAGRQPNPSQPSKGRREVLMMETITYPRKGLSMSDVFNQQLLDRITAQFETWMQGPGIMGGLQMHSCWGKTSVLGKRYQGQTICEYEFFSACAMQLYERTGNPKWKRMVNDFISNVLYLQEPDGGFRHATAEFEPTFTSSPSCPIHQCKPILTLLDYAAWEHADDVLKALIRPAIDRHWDWFQKTFWLRGNGGHHPLPYPAGWCGVTNQDLVAIAALAAYGKLYGDWSRYETYGRPALDVYLSPSYYYEQMGLFERGDGTNFAERTPYYTVILMMLKRIYAATSDARLPGVMDNVVNHLFDAAYTAPDGLTHLAWGATTDAGDKSHVTGWIRTPVTFSAYPGLIPFMEDYLARHPGSQNDSQNDSQDHSRKQAVLDGLKESLCAYIFADGFLPAALWPKDPILSVTSAPDTDKGLLWLYAIRYLGDSLQDPAPVSPRCVHRRLGNYTWKQRGKLWAIERDGERVFGGYTPLAFGITYGPDEEPALGSFAELEECDVLEILPEA